MTDQKRDPQWAQKTLPLDGVQEITLKKAKPVATGESQYGQWNLWTIHVKNATVYDPNKKETVQDYTGDAVTFPTPGMHKEFLKATNETDENVKVSVKKIIKEIDGRPTYLYNVEKVGGGETIPSNVGPDGLKYIADFKTFVDKKVIDGTKEDFIGWGMSDTYKLPKETLEKLWVVYATQ